MHFKLEFRHFLWHCTSWLSLSAYAGEVASIIIIEVCSVSRDITFNFWFFGIHDHFTTMILERQRDNVSFFKINEVILLVNFLIFRHHSNTISRFAKSTLLVSNSCHEQGVGRASMGCDNFSQSSLAKMPACCPYNNWKFPGKNFRHYRSRGPMPLKNLCFKRKGVQTHDHCANRRMC